jgi:hypothetical protein
VGAQLNHFRKIMAMNSHSHCLSAGPAGLRTPRAPLSGRPLRPIATENFLGCWMTSPGRASEPGLMLVSSSSGHSEFIAGPLPHPNTFF